MADTFDARAALSIALDLRQALNDIETFKERGGDLDDLFDRVGVSSREAARFIEKTTGALKETGAAARAARKDIAPDNDSEEWKALAGRVREAEAAYKSLSKTRAASGQSAVDPNAFMRGQGISSADLGAFRQGSGANLLADQSKAAAAQVRSLAQAERDLAEQASPRLRYALYDVSTTARTMAISLTAAGVSVAALAATQESAFTNVERTLDNVGSLGAEGVAGLRTELMGLTREIPLTFSQISEIATLGNQLGIAAGDIAGFTETTARFSAVTGLTVEASATAFGSLRELLRNTDGTELRVEQFENLGSAIALVGRRSVATEGEIVSMTTRLAASATSAGFSAQEVIALSGAFASLRIAPERAQGVMEVYFNRLNTAIAQGGPKLQAFGAVAGVTADEVEGLVRTNPVEFFERVATGLGQMDSIARTGALDALGLSGIRAGEVFGRVASNVGVFNKALGDANQGWSEGTELTSQFNKVLDDLASRWQIFLNAVMEAGGAIGSALAPNIIKALDALSGLLQMLAEFANSPFGEYMFRLAGTAATLLAVLAGVGAVAAVWVGSLFAMRLAAIELGIVTVRTTGGVRGLVASMLGLRTAGAVAASGVARAGTTAGAAAGGMRTLAGAALTARGALVALGRATIVLGIITAATDFLFGLADGANGAGAATGGLAAGLGNAGLAAGDLAPALDDIDWDGATGGADDLGGAAGGAAAQIRTLADYANDLAGVMKRSFDIRFGGQQGFDTILTGWQKITDAANAARDAADEHQRKLAEMGADRSIKQYWLMVAENYGDELRAAKLRAELADLNADMAGEQEDLTKAQSQSNKTLVGNSKAAVENRSEILGLVGNYQSYLQALAASGTSQADLITIAARLRGEFVQQATDLGYNRQEIEKYALAFGDIGTIVSRMPRSVTIEFNGDPAMTALNEFLAQATSAAGAGGSGAGGAFGGGFNDSLWNALNEELPKKGLGKAIERAYTPSEANNWGGVVGGGLVDGLAGQVEVDMSTVTIVGDTWITKEKERSLLAGTNVGSSASGGIKTALSTGLQNYRPIDGWAALQEGYAWNSGRTLGGQIGGGLAAGLNSALAGKKIGSKFSKTGGGFTIEGTGFASGGYTGGTSASEVRGAVHGKEFVMDAVATRTIGVNNLAYMQRMGQKGKAVAPVSGGGGGGMVELSPYDRMLLQEISDRVGITISERSLQSVTNGGNANDAQRRSA